jgi:5'-deoxynucleotidase YfbR-like HD superfamily hydrolase
MWFARVASIAAAVALTASCGGDEGASLSAEEFRDRAEAICREIEETDVRPPSDVSDIDRYADEFTAVIEASASDMHELEPPEEFQDRWQEYLALVDDAVSRFHEVADEIEGASPEEITRLGRQFGADVEELVRRGHAIERELGLDECID